MRCDTRRHIFPIIYGFSNYSFISMTLLHSVTFGYFRNTTESYLLLAASMDFLQDAVITVPVFFNQAERRALQKSAIFSGINVLQLLSEPMAVSLNYGMFREPCVLVALSTLLPKSGVIFA